MREKRPVIAVDIDGVLADFQQGIRNYYQCPDLSEALSWDNYLPSWVSEEEFYSHGYTDPLFYRGVPVYSWARTLLNKVKVKGRVYLLSSCTGNKSVAGKADWVARNFNNSYPAAYLSSVSKFEMFYDILIDDDPNKADWARIMQFPAPYNKGYFHKNQHIRDPFKFVELAETLIQEKLDEFTKL